MSITNTTRSVCDKLSNTFDNTAGGLQNYANNTSREVSNNVTTLKGLSWSSEGDISSGVSSFLGNMNSRIPSSNDVSTILDFINGCSFLGNDDTLKNPIGLTNGLITSVYSEMGNIAEEMSGLLPEFGIGKLFDDIVNMMGFSGIGASLTGLDALIDCVSASCGPEYSSKITSMVDDANSLFSDFNVDSDPTSPTFGDLNLDSIYDKASLTISQKANMNSVMGAFDTAKTTAQSSVNDCVEAIKKTTDVFDW